VSSPEQDLVKHWVSITEATVALEPAKLACLLDKFMLVVTHDCLLTNPGLKAETNQRIKRTLIEFACDSNSMLGQVGPSADWNVIRLTKKL